MRKIAEKLVADFRKELACKVVNEVRKVAPSWTPDQVILESVRIMAEIQKILDENKV